MSQTYVPAELRRLVRARAHDRCEYCLIPELATFAAHEVDHIIAEKHGGQTNADSAALSCVATVQLLQLNDPDRVEEREALLAAGLIAMPGA
jgi:hypothetical protein